MEEKSDPSDWYFTGSIFLLKDNFKEIKRSKVGRETELLKKINEYIGENCYIPTDGNCFIKCVNYVLNKDLTNEFQNFINGFSKANRKGVMTSARINEFNNKCDISFKIYTHNNRNLRPAIVKEELDWVLYLHNSHFCLIRRNKKSLGIKEIEGNYEQVWKMCRDDNAVTQVSPLKLNVFSSISDVGLFAWDCETYSESETRKAIPYACTLINLEKLRKMLDRINNLFPDLNPTDNVPEEFYDKLMNIVEIFAVSNKFLTFKGQIEIDGEIFQDGKHKQFMKLLGFNAETFHTICRNMEEKSDPSDWYFTGSIFLLKDNFKEIKRSKVGRETELLKKINEYIGENCYIPTDGNCFIKCVNYVLNKDLTNEFQNFINGFSKANRKGVMTSARINEFNNKCDISFQIYTHNNRNLRPTIVKEELDWVLYLHNSHFCLIRRNKKSLGIKEIEDNYEQVWKTCRDDNAVTQKLSETKRV
ncbi:hypothetical protein LOTGIDRAFT_170755 [Lottia gigantea]|uniref:OTU domain-containing protein n=1 Tax=Lottia gigantea TaxID=225164 RepID=V4AJY8_LOTGI|nr:hypothetical protein LOTGIDRAFT_170755 [Lottia gigantea]ESP04509.1 hypothetical protein LOTGIDRAFT_170755 [Lottia gigantea]